MLLIELPQELQDLIFTFLELKEIVKLERICHSMNKLVSNSNIYKHLIKKRIMNKYYLSFVIDLHYKHYLSQFLNFKPPFDNVLLRGVDQSSLDHRTQSIDQAIQTNPETFWSSKGSSNPDSDEYLVFKLSSSITVVNSIQIKPFRAIFQRNRPIYPPKQFKISVGFSPNPDEMHFNSKVFDCQNPQDYSFDYNPIYSFNLFSSFPVGTFLCVHLLGKYTRQPGDELFYSCLENVKINGITIENMFGYYDARLVAKTIINYSVDILSKLLKSSSIEKFINLSDSKISSLLISYISDNQSHESWNELESELISQSKLLLSEHLKIDSILKQLKSLIYSGEITEAVDLIILHSNMNELRNYPVLGWFEDVKFHEIDVLSVYFNRFFDLSIKLNLIESELYAKYCIENHESLRIFATNIRSNLVTTSEAIGNLVKPINPYLAISIYLSNSSFEKMIYLMMDLHDYLSVLSYILLIPIQITYPELFTYIAGSPDSELLSISHQKDYLEGSKEFWIHMFGYCLGLSLSRFIEFNNCHTYSNDFSAFRNSVTSIFSVEFPSKPLSFSIAPIEGTKERILQFIMNELSTNEDLNETEMMIMNRLGIKESNLLNCFNDDLNCRILINEFNSTEIFNLLLNYYGREIIDMELIQLFDNEFLKNSVRLNIFLFGKLIRLAQ